jgi:hypothetical protein
LVTGGVSLLIEGDFIGQAEVAVALPVVEKYLAKAVMTGWVIEMPGRGSLILKEWRVFDGGGFGLLRDGQKSAIITTLTVGKYRHRLGLYYRQ